MTLSRICSSPTLRPRSAECLRVWIANTLQGLFLAVFATELGERNANKTCTLKGVTCTVCYCTGLIKNWLNIFVVALAAYDDDDGVRYHDMSSFNASSFPLLKPKLAHP